MVEHSDESLVKRSAMGDERAFVELVRRYEQPIATLIRYSVGNADDAQDVMQEALLQAWVGIRRVREPGNVRAWLMQVARNRCRDFRRARREEPVDPVFLEEQITAHGACRPDQRVSDALHEVTGADREIFTLFYLEGLTIAEIAQRQQRPTGTVKRRLHEARQRIREALGVTERTSKIMAHRPGSKSQPFPASVPDIEIARLDAEPFSIDCREMKWWCIVPEVGDRAMKGDYCAPDWRISHANDLRAIRRASIHEVEGVEVEVDEWDRDAGWKSGLFFYGRVREETVQWLAGMRKGEDMQIRTFLDEGFVWAFPELKRMLRDEEVFETAPDGSIRSTRPYDDVRWAGSGYFEVRIGDGTFRCLRVIGQEAPVESEHCAVTETFVADNGRTVLSRAYCHAGMDGFPTDPRRTITLDGVTFEHWYDMLTDTACGITVS